MYGLPPQSLSPNKPPRRRFHVSISAFSFVLPYPYSGPGNTLHPHARAPSTGTRLSEHSSQAHTSETAAFSLLEAVSRRIPSRQDGEYEEDEEGVESVHESVVEQWRLSQRKRIRVLIVRVDETSAVCNNSVDRTNEEEAEAGIEAFQACSARGTDVREHSEDGEADQG
jgi:hypothetical protein